MMDISGVTPNTTTNRPDSAKTALNGDFDTFLKMMTVQLKNQDPLNPVDSADYAMQLATFSGVEQQIKTNQLLGGLTSQVGVVGLAQLAGWVGQEARSAAPVHLDGSPVTISYSAASQADHAVLVVKDSSGKAVAREDVPLKSDNYQWLGGGSDGNILPSGNYTLSLESYKGEDQLGDPTEVESYSRIMEVRGGADGATLLLQSGAEVAATKVTALRAS